MSAKICKTCNEEKELIDYHFRKDSQKYREDCKECIREKDRQDNNRKRQEQVEYFKIRGLDPCLCETCGSNTNRYLIICDTCFADIIGAIKIQKEKDRLLSLGVNLDLQHQCSKCEIIKSKDEFYLCSIRKNKPSNICKTCTKLDVDTWRNNNSDKFKTAAKQWKLNNKEKEKARKWLRNQTPSVKIHGRMSRGIRNFLNVRDLSKDQCSWLEFVDYSLTDLLQHIQLKFSDGMSWDNLANIEIDHIYPQSLFTITSPEDEGFKLCWSLENLMPLWKDDNLRKYNNMPELYYGDNFKEITGVSDNFVKTIHEYFRKSKILV